MIRSNISTLFDLWPAGAQTLIVAGTADDHEAQTVTRFYPGTVCVGVEPNPEYAALQRGKLAFPGAVHEVALWHRDDQALTLSYLEGRPVVGSVCRPFPSPDLGDARMNRHVKVRTRTLDSMAAEFGPWDNVVLWLDVEFAELNALRGATALLQRTLLVNVETFVTGNLPAVCDIMYGAGLHMVRVWNVGECVNKDAQDYVFVRR